MKLFEVEVTTVVYVWAEDRHDAEHLAERHIYDEVLHDSNAREIRPESGIDSDWADSCPYGDAPDGFDNLTVEEIVDKWNGPDEGFVPDLETLPLPFSG